MATTESPLSEDAGPRARRQLRRVLVLLGVLDLSVLVLVIGLVLAAPSLGFTTAELLFSILAGIVVILGVRIWLAVQLRRRSGDLFKRPSGPGVEP
jgi:hypothetical protein